MCIWLKTHKINVIIFHVLCSPYLLLLDKNHAFTYRKSTRREEFQRYFDYSIHTIHDIFLEMEGIIELNVEIKFYNRQFTTKREIKR
ncbi:hypothetical protein B1B04_17955 [Lysinibacillus sp. KCTC 33748]|nr:hypothetical protein B1B04_17955 [Lysinibacillus sp. KCTC 33748]